MIRGFIRFAVERPILNHILMVFMLLMSIFAYQNIAKEIFPASTLDEISISGGYVGASADVLDKMVVKQIEDELKSLSEIDTIYTTIQNGLSPLQPISNREMTNSWYSPRSRMS